MSRRLIYSLSLLLIGVGMIMKLASPPNIEPQEAPQSQTSSTESAKEKTTATGPLLTPSSHTSVQSKVAQLATQIGRTTNDPVEITQQLQRYADQLPPSAIAELKDQALSENINMDTRFMSIELIGLSPASQVRNHALTEIVLSAWTEGKNPTFTDYEKALRAQAIEHLYNSQSQQELIQISSSTPSPFLKDRALRSLAALRGDGPPPEEQDRAAIGELLKPPK